MSTGTVKQICRICLEPVEDNRCPKCEPLWYTCINHSNHFWTGKQVCPECGPDPKAVLVETVDEDMQFWETVAEEVEEKIEQIPAPPTPPTDEDEGTEAEEGQPEETPAEGITAEKPSREKVPEEKALQRGA